MTAGWLVIPAYNEAAGIAAHLDTLAAFVADQGRQAGVHFTLLVVDDGSRDATRAQVAGSVARLEEQGVSLLLLPLVRNFGQQAAIIAGLLFAAAIVHTVRRPHDLGWFKRKASAAYYALISCRLHAIAPQQYLDEALRLLPYWPQKRHLELAPKLWKTTRAKLRADELAAPLGPFTIPAA